MGDDGAGGWGPGLRRPSHGPPSGPGTPAGCGDEPGRPQHRGFGASMTETHPRAVPEAGPGGWSWRLALRGPAAWLRRWPLSLACRCRPSVVSPRGRPSAHTQLRVCPHRWAQGHPSEGGRAHPDCLTGTHLSPPGPPSKCSPILRCWGSGPQRVNWGWVGCDPAHGRGLGQRTQGQGLRHCRSPVSIQEPMGTGTRKTWWPRWIQRLGLFLGFHSSVYPHKPTEVN